MSRGDDPVGTQSLHVDGSVGHALARIYQQLSSHISRNLGHAIDGRDTSQGVGYVADGNELCSRVYSARQLINVEFLSLSKSNWSAQEQHEWRLKTSSEDAHTTDILRHFV